MWTQRSIDLGEPLGMAQLNEVAGARALVMFAHADGPGRTGQRHAPLVQGLQRLGLHSLSFDLLTPQEAADPATIADVPLLIRRLLQGLQALPEDRRDLPIGIVGTDTGAAAALAVAAQQPQRIRALVLLGGRVDLAQDVIGDVSAATLLLIGDADPDVLAHNRAAYRRLHGEKRIDVVPRASHLFLEAGAMAAAGHRAADWFAAHLPGAR